MQTSYQTISIESIKFDNENPRIKVALEKYGDESNEQRVRFALKTATEGSTSTSSYSALKDSIRASGGILVPVVITPSNGQFLCIDGNTRLAVYRELAEEGAAGKWDEIRCLVLDDVEQSDIEAIRVTAHLVGAREWPAYEKARYLHHLRNEKFFDYEVLVQMCGGSRKTIEQQIDAFHEMNEFYRDVNSDDVFQADRFSGFVELQKPRIKDAIFTAGFDLNHFGEWIRDGQINRLADVRKLPLVLADEEATHKFINGGYRSIEEAIELANANRQAQSPAETTETNVANASLATLSSTLLDRLKSLPRQDQIALRDRQYESAEEEIETLRDLVDYLRDLLQDVAK